MARDHAAVSNAVPHTIARRSGLLLVLAAVLAGCGGSATIQGGNDIYSATTLTVYSDLPLLGPDGPQMSAVVDGEILALYNAGGHVGRLHVSIESLNDSAEVPITGASHTAQTALSAGMIAAVVAPEELPAAAWARAEALTKLPLGSLLETKRLIREPIRAILADTMAKEFEALGRRLISAEAAAAFQALMTRK